MKEINEMLLKLSSKKIKNTNSINRLGLSVPVVRAQLKNELPFTGETNREKLDYWDDVWKNSPYFESISLALYFTNTEIFLSKNLIK